MNTRYRKQLIVLLTGAFGIQAGWVVAQKMTPRTPRRWQIDSSVTMSPIGGTRKNAEKLCITLKKQDKWKRCPASRRFWSATT